MEILYISLAITLTAFILFFLFTYIPYRLTFYRNPKKHSSNPKRVPDKPGYREFRDRSLAMIDNILSIEGEDVYTVSRDGLRLHALYYHRSDSAPLVICHHGYKSTPMRDFSGGGVMMMDFGFNVLIIDQRAHGKSEGRALTFGDKESLDSLCWIDYAIERLGPDVKIVLQGISMGGATVLLASALKLPDNVLGIMADCPYSSAKEIIVKTIKEMGLPPRLFYPLVRLGGILYASTDPSKANPKEAARAHKVPILLIHGEADSMVPSYMSDEIYEAIREDERSRLYKFKNAEHGMSYMNDTEGYHALVLDFLISLGISEIKK